MNKIFLGAVLLAAISLAACGGGSSGGGPIPNPGPTSTPIVTPSPTPTRAVAYTWTGALHPSASTSVMITGASGDPVMDAVCNPQVESPGCVGYAQPQITVTETGPSPHPTGPPTISPPPNVQVTPEPTASPFSYRMDPITSVSPGPYTINVAFSDGTTGTIPLNVYQSITVGCPGSGSIGSMPAGWSFDSNAPETTIAASDIYVTGPNCPGEFADPSAPSNGYQIHTPYGSSVYYFNQIDFATVSSSLIVSPQTAYAFSSGDNPINHGFVIGYTKEGGTFALVLAESWNNGPNPPYTDGDYFSGALKYATMGQPFPY